MSTTTTDSQEEIGSTEENSYTVHLRGEVFHLSHSQIAFDSPNYFTACFQSGFSEAHSRTLRLDRHPALFAIIVDYLSGYPVLPLSTRAIPAAMDMPTALRYLLADAQFYRLQGLCDILTQPTSNINFSWAGFASEFVNLRDVLSGNLPEGILKKEDGSIVSAESRLPVLIYAHDMVLKIVTTSKSHKAQAPTSQYPQPYEVSYFIEISYPTSPAAARTYTAAVFLSHASSEHPTTLRTKTVHADGSLVIDGELYGLSSVDWNCSTYPEGFWRLKPFIRGEPHVWTTPYADASEFEWKHWAWTFWADEVITCFSAPSGSQSGQETTATLISARMRSLPGIPADLRSQIAR